MITKSPRSILSVICSAGAVAAALFSGAVSTAFAAASLTPLGFLPGETASGANGVSADGSVVVGWSTADGYGREAFRWTSDGGIVGLGHLPGGSIRSEAKGVSADGSVIVGWGSVSDSLSREAFRWTAGGGMVALGFLPGGSYSEANDVSADGSVITGHSGGTGEAFRWTSDGGMVGLGGLASEDQGGSAAVGVSANGSVIVGRSASLPSGIEAFRWSSDGGMVGLCDLPGGDFFSGATGVSGDGSVVVGWDYSDSLSLSGYEAFRWTAGGGMVGLGHLFSGETGEPTGVSADGSVIVGYSLSSDYEAFRWTSDGGMERLWDVLLAAGVDPAADGWTGLLAAYDISADGSTIVGNGYRNGNIEAFVAVIPFSSPLPGDFNGDNVVDAADYVLWRKNPGGIYTPDDYNTWRANFGQSYSFSGNGSSSSTSAGNVPEPAIISFLLFAMAGLCVPRRRAA
jgi:probable HAF family extracellular repeat protein